MDKLPSQKASVAKTSLVEKAYFLLNAMRPIHWAKNLSLFAALIFSGNLFSSELFVRTVIAFISFNFATSFAYILNDIIDRKRDALHPIKKRRPIASGKVSIPLAILTMTILLAISVYIASTLGPFFLLSVLAYLIPQLTYTFFLKNLPIIDILIIASGFILRVYAGAFVINAHLSVWFLLCVISVALFLAAGKRRAEFGAISAVKGVTRLSLTKYRKNLLDSYVTMFGNAAFLSWALFTFFESPPPTLPVWLFLAELSKTTTVSKFLMITIPVVLFGIMRYESLIFEDRTESPEKLLLTDIPLVTSVFIWGVLVVGILYGGLAAI